MLAVSLSPLSCIKLHSANVEISCEQFTKNPKITSEFQTTLNQIIIVTSSQSAVYGVLGNSYENFQIWKDPYPITKDQLEKIIERTGRSTPEPTPQDILLYGLLEKNNLLDIILCHSSPADI